MLAVIPIHFLSVEHLKLEERLGRQKGEATGMALGLLSGWGLFLFWIGVWISPQPRFDTPILSGFSLQLPVIGVRVPMENLIPAMPLVGLGAWLGIAGVRETTLKVSETHRPDRIVTTGVYSRVRHPQYLGGLVSHIGMSILLSGWYALLSTPIVVVLVYAISWKEEQELVKEFGHLYRAYAMKVPMLLPRLFFRVNR